jgi:hypothetical protein
LLVPVVDAPETPSLLQSRNSLEKFVRSAHGILQFDYDDLKYLNYPKENPEYLARIRSTFEAAADDIVGSTTTRQ